MSTERRILTFAKGITRVPGDALCDDNTLEECVGLTYADGEHHIIQRPKLEYGDVSGRLLFVHRIGGGENLITLSDDGRVMCGSQTLVSGASTDVIVASLGKTLVVNVDSVLHYVLWKEGTYKCLGSSIPDIRVRFSLDDFSNRVYGSQKHVDLTEMLDGRVLKESLVYTYSSSSTLLGSFFKNDSYDDAKAALTGLVSMRLDEIREQRRFAFPFWARYAVRLYDGSYTNISNPVLLLPTVRNNWHIFTCDDNGEEKVMDGASAGGWAQTNYKPWHAKLKYQLTLPSGFDASEWRDIISGVDIFVSEETKTFDMDGQWSVENAYTRNDGTSNQYTLNPLFDGHTVLADTCSPQFSARQRISAFTAGNSSTYKIYYRPTLLSENEIIDKLIVSSAFYKVAEHSLGDGLPTVEQDASETIGRGTLKTLKTQPQLKHDDYFSRAGIGGNVMKVYNGRLHLGNVRRGFFEGFGHFSFTQYPSATTENYTYFVHIAAESGERIVRHDNIFFTGEIVDVWYYYPDTRAKRVEVFAGGRRVGVLSLREHPSLNGAYAFPRLPAAQELQSLKVIDRPDVYSEAEQLEEHVYVSEVDNPWVFTAAGDIRTGLGTVIGMAAQSMSVGELEHGIHPFIVFGSRGISLLRLSESGVYLRSDEKSREVCNNPSSITEVDGPVFFSSEKGLMVFDGNKAECVSSQLDGRASSYNIGAMSFRDYLRGAFIAYDYRDSLLWIFNTSSGFEEYCYVYSIKSGTFSKCFLDPNIEAAVNVYPDYLLQSRGGSVYSLLHRDAVWSETVQADSYDAVMISRPMSLGSGLSLKSIMRLKNTFDFSDPSNASITLSVSGSDDLAQWRSLSSLRGKPWKYYRFKYIFTGMTYGDSFIGTTIDIQERRTNKLR